LAQFTNDFHVLACRFPAVRHVLCT
jgi:hypothetical protein